MCQLRLMRWKAVSNVGEFFLIPLIIYSSVNVIIHITVCNTTYAYTLLLKISAFVIYWGKAEKSKIELFVMMLMLWRRRIPRNSFERMEKENVGMSIIGMFHMNRIVNDFKVKCKIYSTMGIPASVPLLLPLQPNFRNTYSFQICQMVKEKAFETPKADILGKIRYFLLFYWMNFNSI